MACAIINQPRVYPVSPQNPWVNLHVYPGSNLCSQKASSTWPLAMLDYHGTQGIRNIKNDLRNSRNQSTSVQAWTHFFLHFPGILLERSPRTTKPQTFPNSSALWDQTITCTWRMGWRASLGSTNNQRTRLFPSTPLISFAGPKKKKSRTFLPASGIQTGLLWRETGTNMHLFLLTPVRILCTSFYASVITYMYNKWLHSFTTLLTNYMCMQTLRHK